MHLPDPGGQIFINSGLFEALESEDEIAGIIAHEISHVACRHISQQIEQSKKVGMGTLAGVAAGILLGAAGAGGAAASAAAIGSMAAGQSFVLAHSREDEMQADQRGVDFLTQAGYNPKGTYDGTDQNPQQAVVWKGSGSHLHDDPPGRRRPDTVIVQLDRSQRFNNQPASPAFPESL